MSRQVVLVEDDSVIRENYTEILTDEGFAVDSFSNRHDAMAHFRKNLPDVALVDICLEEEREGGFQLCTDLRHMSPKLPIIFLTSRDSEFDKISGLRLGADDYLTKDISIHYLIVRIEALLRRITTFTNLSDKRKPGDMDCAEDGPLFIDRDKLVAFWKNQPVDLTLTQFWIVQELAGNPGQVKSYSKLMRAANVCVEPNTITAHIKTIRDRFKALDSEFNCIKSERGIGYRWVDI